MIMSMTGFGSGRIETEEVTVAVEAKTVNHRYLDIHVRLPPEYQSLEAAVRKAVSSRLRRGRVDVFVKLDETSDRVRITADPALIQSYVDLIRDLQSRFHIAGELTVDAIARLPGAIRVSSEELTAEDHDTLARRVEQATLRALDQVLEMRSREGEALFQDMERRVEAIARHLETVRQGADSLIQHYREILSRRIEELAPKVEVDSSRLEVEVLMYAERSDIAEEITRLESHIEQFAAARSSGGEAGKRMDFLLQEMNREVTTVLSKTSGLNQAGAAIGAAAIEIKVEIDKLREQVQNIE